MLLPGAGGKETSGCPSGFGCEHMESSMSGSVFSALLSSGLRNVTVPLSSEEGRTGSSWYCQACYCQLPPTARPHTHTHTHTHLPLRDFSVPHFSGAGVLQSVPDSLNYFYFSTESAEEAPVTMFYFDSGHLNWSKKAKAGQPAPLIFYEILIVL